MMFRTATVFFLLASPCFAQDANTPTDKWMSFVTQQWSIARAVCREDIASLQVQLSDALKQIEELKKAKK